MRSGVGLRLSKVEEESESDAFGKQKHMFSSSDFEDVLSNWWKESDTQSGGSLQLSAERIAVTFVKNGVFKEVETARRNLILQVHHNKTKAPLTTYPAPGEDILSLEDYQIVFCKGIFRELLTQLAEKLKEVMEHALSKNVHLTLNRHLNNYQRALMLE